jgi:hypothetical protein
MTTQHLHLPSGRSLLEFFRHHTLVKELRAFFASLFHREPEADTSIAWEDGESDRR